MEIPELHISGIDFASRSIGQIAVVPAIGPDHALDILRHAHYHRMNHCCFLPAANPDGRPIRLQPWFAMLEGIAGHGILPRNIESRS